MTANQVHPSAPPSPLPDRPILVLGASTGGGHMSAARALGEAISAREPGARVEVRDSLELTGAIFRRVYGNGYLAMVNWTPLLFGALYDATDRPPGPVWDRWRQWQQRICGGAFSRYVRRVRPRLIVNTHFLPAEYVAALRRAGRLDCPQAIVTTDFEAHRLWAQTPAERYYVASGPARLALTVWGAAEKSIRMTGIPVRRAFLDQPPAAECRARLGLDEGPPVVLLLCGGFGVGPIRELLRELMAMPGEPQIAVIAGRNERLRSRLTEESRAAGRRVRVVGYTDEMHTWMRAATVAVTKPGGLTVSEALVCGLPIAIVSPIPGPEARNSDWLLEQGAAIKVNHPKLLGRRIAALLAEPAELARMAAASARAGRPQAAAEIAEDVLSLCEPTAGETPPANRTI